MKQSPSTSELVDALRLCLSAMEMQEKRDAGEFHIPQSTAWAIWSEAKAAAAKFVAMDS